MKNIKFILMLFILFPLLIYGAVIPTSVGYNKQGKPFIQRENRNFLASGVTYHMMDHKNSWETDLETMKELGINIIRIDFGWQDIEKENNAFDMSILDRFISLAQSRGFLLLVSLAPNSTKTWIPEWMISGPLSKETWHLMDQSGQVPSGGWWNIPSPANETYVRYFQRYQAFVISHIRTNSCILGYLLYNEPHFAGGKEDPWFDYNPDAVKKFQTWLGQTYGNNIKALNKAWHTAYKKFTEVSPISSIPAGWRDLALQERKRFQDWRKFSSRLWVEFMDALIRNAKQSDKDHVVMVTEMPWWFWGEGSKAGVVPDIYEKADIIGLDVYPGSDPADQDVPAAAVNMLMTYYQNKKPVWLSEINEKSGNPDKASLMHNISSSFDQGATGVLFFEWSDKGEKIDGGAYGLMKDTKIKKPGFGYYKDVVEQLKKRNKYDLGASLPEPAAYVIWSEDNMHETYQDIDYAYMIRGVFSMLNRNNVNLNIIKEEQFLSGEPFHKLPLLVPSLLFLKAGFYDKLVQYVKDGNPVFCDAGFGQWWEDPSFIISEKGTLRNFPELDLTILSGTKDVESRTIDIQNDFYGLSVKDAHLTADDYKEVLGTGKNGSSIGTWNDSSDPAMVAFSLGNKGKVFYSGTKIMDGCVWKFDRESMNLHRKVLLAFLRWSGRNIPDVPDEGNKAVPSVEVEKKKSTDNPAQVIDTEQYSFLRLPYNQDFISFPLNYSSGTGYDLPGEEMSQFDTEFECMMHDADFIMIGASDKNNTMECRGQKIFVNSNRYIKVHILGCTHSKAEEAEFVLKYRNPNKTVILPFFIEDWWGGCNKENPEEHCGLSFSHHNEKDGPRDPEVHLMHKTINLEEYGFLEWIKFPYSNNFRILAVTLEKKNYFLYKK